MTDRKEYMKAYHQAHKEQAKAYNKAWQEANKEYMKAYYQAHKEQAKATTKAWREANKDHHKATTKAWYEANKEQRKAYMKVWHEANKEEIKEYQKADVNSLGETKASIRLKSLNILKKSGIKIPGYEIHHCFGYEDPSKFIYISKSLHLKIHQYLRDNSIDADSDHWMAIRDLVNSTDEFMYIKC